MKVEKSERHSSILHFHRQDCFLNQGCWGMTQNTMKNTFARYQQSHELLLFFTSKNVSFFQVMFFFLENRQLKSEMNNSFFKVKLRLWKLNDFILEVKMTKLTSFFLVENWISFWTIFMVILKVKPKFRRAVEISVKHIFILEKFGISSFTEKKN